MLQYVVHVLIEKLCADFLFIIEDRIVEISYYIITKAPLVGRIV